MTVCLKCGAENPPANRYCARCELPLADRGVGTTLTGSAPDAPHATPTPIVAGPSLIGPAGTLVAKLGANSWSGGTPSAGAAQSARSFEQTSLGVAARPEPGTRAGGAPTPAAPLPVAPLPGVFGGQTLFGVTPGGSGTFGTDMAQSAAAPERPAPARPGDGSRSTDGFVPQRTMLGVFPEDVARVIAAASRSTPEASPREDTRSAPNPHGQSVRSSLPERTGTASFEPVRAASTLLGTAGSMLGAAWPVPVGRTEGAPASSPIPPDPAAAAATEEAARAAAASFAAAASATGAAAPTPAAVPALHARTHLGVALPGIAPLRAGKGNAPLPAPAAPTELAVDAGPEITAAATSAAVRVPVPRGALVLLSSGIVLLASAGAFALFWSGGKPLSANLGADASGKDRIDLVCAECADGTLLSLGERSAEVRDRKAHLFPPTPLPLGQNTLAINLQRPGASHAETVQVRLPPLEYRIRPDTSTLSADPPRLSLDIEALAGTQVQIAGGQVPLDPSGRGHGEIALGGELNGPASDVSSFEQSAQYVITPPSGKEYRGELRVKIGITPLMLEAPGADSMTELERFMLAGQTTRGAVVQAAGSPIPVDDTGHFAQLMSIDSVGETKVTVRASQTGLAPRFVSFRLERVKSLEEAVNARRRNALSLSEVTRDIPGHVGSTVFLRGKIAEIRADGQRTLLIVEADGDCHGPCLARLSYGGLRKLERGGSITALGRVERVVTAPGKTAVPEIEISILL